MLTELSTTPEGSGLYAKLGFQCSDKSLYHVFFILHLVNLNIDLPTQGSTCCWDQTSNPRSCCSACRPA